MNTNENYHVARKKFDLIIGILSVALCSVILAGGILLFTDMGDSAHAVILSLPALPEQLPPDNLMVSNNTIIIEELESPSAGLKTEPEKEPPLLEGNAKSPPNADSQQQKPDAFPVALPEKIYPGKWVLIEKTKFALTLFDRDKIIKQYRIAVGKNGGDKQKKGDNRTPDGVFKVQQVQNASAWTHDFRDGKGIIKGAYGPWFIRLSTPPWTGIGIHGTHDPDSIGTRASEGCIRLKNEDIQNLKEQVQVGMTVVIKE